MNGLSTATVLVIYTLGAVSALTLIGLLVVIARGMLGATVFTEPGYFTQLFRAASRRFLERTGAELRRIPGDLREGFFNGLEWLVYGHA